MERVVFEDKFRECTIKFVEIEDKKLRIEGIRENMGILKREKTIFTFVTNSISDFEKQKETLISLGRRSLEEELMPLNVVKPISFDPDKSPQLKGIREKEYTDSSEQHLKTATVFTFDPNKKPIIRVSKEDERKKTQGNLKGTSERDKLGHPVDKLRDQENYEKEVETVTRDLLETAKKAIRMRTINSNSNKQKPAENIDEKKEKEKFSTTIDIEVPTGKVIQESYSFDIDYCRDYLKDRNPRRYNVLVHLADQAPKCVKNGILSRPLRRAKKEDLLNAFIVMFHAADFNLILKNYYQHTEHPDALPNAKDYWKRKATDPRKESFENQNVNSNEENQESTNYQSNKGNRSKSWLENNLSDNASCSLVEGEKVFHPNYLAKFNMKSLLPLCQKALVDTLKHAKKTNIFKSLQSVKNEVLLNVLLSVYKRYSIEIKHIKEENSQKQESKSKTSNKF